MDIRVKDLSFLRPVIQCKRLLSLLNCRTSVWINIVLAKYGLPNSWSIDWKNKMSWVFRGLMHDLDILKVGFAR